MHPDDARRLGLSDGERIRVRSEYGEAELPLKLNAAIQEGQLFTTFHTAQVFINEVTNPHRDGYTHTPEYKVTAVQVERAPGTGPRTAAPVPP
jgi:formate dehydrogenase major subunit